MSDLNLSNFFYSAPEGPDKKALGKIAINEDGVVGFIASVKTIGTTKIYVGMELSKGLEWVSLAPTVLNSKINLRAAMEMFYVLQDVKKSELKAKMDISISPPIIPGVDIGDPSTWQKISFNQDATPENFQSFIEKILFSDGFNPQSNNPYSENDFKIDNEDEDGDNH